MKTASFTATTLAFVLAASLAPCAARAAPTFVAVELAAPSGAIAGGLVYANGMNNLGDVVGVACLDVNGNNCQAFVANTSQFTLLPGLGSVFSTADDINDAGQVVGSFSNGNLPAYAFLYSAGVMTQPGSLGGSYTVASAINNAGVVVGRSASSGIDGAQGFSYSAGVLTSLQGLLGGVLSEAADINDAGQIAGAVALPGLDYQAYRLDGAAVQLLGTLGGSNSVATGISSNGAVAGISKLAADHAAHAFLWRDGAMTDLGTLGGSNSWARAVNRQGWVVGTSETATSIDAVFLYRDGAMSSLADLVDLGPDWYLTDASDLNDRGQIVVNAFNLSTSQRTVFRLDPIAAQQAVPAPATASLVLAALALAAAQRRHARHMATAQA